MENYIYIDRDDRGNYIIHGEHNGKYFPKVRYIGYGKREAVKRFRQENGLARKRLWTIDATI